MEYEGVAKFIVETISEKSGKPLLSGKFDRELRDEKLYVSYLCFDEFYLVEGHFKGYSQRTRKAEFSPLEAFDAGVVETGKPYYYFDGYWGEMAELVCDTSLIWQKKEFMPMDAIRHEDDNETVFLEPADATCCDDDGTKTVIEGGWNHEHCVFCNTTIDTVQNTSFMESNQEDIVCVDCYDKYISKRSFGFIMME